MLSQASAVLVIRGMELFFFIAERIGAALFLKPKRRAYGHFVAYVKDTNVADYFDQRMTEVCVRQGGEVDLVYAHTVNHLAVAENSYLALRIVGSNVEFTVGAGGRVVSSFWSGDSVHQTQRFEGLHLIADRSGVAPDNIGNIFPFYRMRILMIKRDKCNKDIFLDQRQIHTDCSDRHPNKEIE